MDRQKIMNEIKAEYAHMADRESRDSFVGQTGGKSPEAYYETLLNEVLAAVEAGSFDHCTTGREVVELVANDHQKYGISL